MMAVIVLLAATTQCPAHCSGHGRCVNETAEYVCICDRGYRGSSCAAVDSAACRHSCSGHGTCNSEGGCDCDLGFFGSDCSRALPRACPSGCSGHGICDDGLCSCNPGFGGSTCSIVLQHSPGCPGNCSARGLCTGGSCACSAGFTGFACEAVDAKCPSNCTGHGRCITRRQSSRSLTEGSASRGIEKVDNSVADAAWVCACDAGWSGTTCNRFRAAEQRCPHGCSGHGRCLGSKCLCDDGFRGPDCSEVARGRLGCPRGCSGHGSCRAGRLDIDGPLPGVRLLPAAPYGMCECDAGSGGDACEIGYSIAPVCPFACSGRGLCRSGGCACEAGFGGNDCGVACPHRCSEHGVCTDEGVCLCETGHSGAFCEHSSECPNACSGRGRCAPAGDARAAADRAEQLEEHARRAVAISEVATTALEETEALVHAALTAAKQARAAVAAAAAYQCHCARGWAGALDCSVRDGCPLGCVHGACDSHTGECICDRGWHGLSCATSDALSRAAALASHGLSASAFAL